jgi:hypothetical protein
MPGPLSQGWKGTYKPFPCGSGRVAALFLTSAADGGEWSASLPGRLTTRKKLLYPVERRPRGLQSLSEWKKNLLALPGIAPRPYSQNALDGNMRYVEGVSQHSRWFCWQSWGNAMDTLQAATLLAALTSQLYVYCWFGSELTQQVSRWSRPPCAS